MRSAEKTQMKTDHDCSPESTNANAQSALAPARCSASPSDAEIIDLKERINGLIWEYAPPETSIGDAEDLACKIFNSVRAGKYLI